MDNTNINVEFRIIGDKFDLFEITNLLDITPSKTWSIDDEVHQTGKKHTYTCWAFSTGNEETLDINTQLNKVYECFINKVDILVKLKEKYNLEYCIDIIVIVENNEEPAMYLEPDLLRFAANIGARIDFDLYIN